MKRVFINKALMKEKPHMYSRFKKGAIFIKEERLNDNFLHF